MCQFGQQLLEAILQTGGEAAEAVADVLPGASESFVDTVHRALGELAPGGRRVLVLLVFKAQQAQGILVLGSLVRGQLHGLVQGRLRLGVFAQQLLLGIQPIHDAASIRRLLGDPHGLLLGLGRGQQLLILLAADSDVLPGQGNLHRLLDVVRLQRSRAL